MSWCLCCLLDGWLVYLSAGWGQCDQPFAVSVFALCVRLCEAYLAHMCLSLILTDEHSSILEHIIDT